VQKSKLPDGLAEVLPTGVRVSRYYTNVAQLAETIANQSRLHHDVAYGPLAEEISHFRRAVVQLLEIADPSAAGYSVDECAAALNETEYRYQQLKAALLRDGTEERITIHEMVAQLELMSHIRRLAEQAEKGARYLYHFNAYTPAAALEESETSSKEPRVC